MRVHLRPFAAVLAFCWLLLLAGIPEAMAQRRKKVELPPAPPPVVPGEVSVYAGESIEVPLAIHGRRAGQLEFLIRTPPKAGKLSAVASTGANTASVAYTAPEGAGIIEDRFTYAVRSSEGVSAPGVVSIKIRMKPRLPGRLEAPDVLAFPDTIAGEESVAMLEIRNPGAGETKGKIEVAAPWSVDGSPEYELASKGSAQFRLLFRPESTGSMKGEAVLGPQPRRVVALSGEALPPILVKPARLALASAEEGRTRKGTLQIENLSTTRKVITFSTDARLMSEESVELESGDTAQVPVFAEPGDGASFETVVKLSAGGWKQEIPVEVEPLKQRLKLDIDAPDKLKGIAGEPAEFGVIIENEGGRMANARITVTPPFRADEAVLAIGPGEKKRARISGEVAGPGEHAVEIAAVTESAVERLKVVYSAEGQLAAPRMGRDSAAIAAPSLPVQAVAAKPALERPAPLEAPESAERAMPARITSTQLTDHPNALGYFTQDVSWNRANLAWPAELGGKGGVEIEERRLALNAERALKMDWVRLPHAQFHATGEQLRVELTQLRPETIYTVRARSGGETIFTAQFLTKPKPPLLPFGWRGALLGGLFVFLALLAWRRWKMNRRSHW